MWTDVSKNLTPTIYGFDEHFRLSLVSNWINHNIIRKIRICDLIVSASECYS